MMIYWGHEAQEKIDGYKALEAQFSWRAEQGQA
jgi:hypothetical protein